MNELRQYCYEQQPFGDLDLAQYTCMCVADPLERARPPPCSPLPGRLQVRPLVREGAV